MLLSETPGACSAEQGVSGCRGSFLPQQRNSRQTKRHAVSFFFVFVVNRTVTIFSTSILTQSCLIRICSGALHMRPHSLSIQASEGSNHDMLYRSVSVSPVFNLTTSWLSLSPFITQSPVYRMSLSMSGAGRPSTCMRRTPSASALPVEDAAGTTKVVSPGESVQQWQYYLAHRPSGT